MDAVLKEVANGMDNLIRRQDAIDAIHKVIFSVIDAKSPLTVIDKQILSISKAITTKIKELPSAQQWIPVSERLPEKHNVVLAIAADEIAFAWRNIDGRWRSLNIPQDLMNDGRVTSWMYLSDLWEGGDSSGS